MVRSLSLVLLMLFTPALAFAQEELVPLPPLEEETIVQEEILSDPQVVIDENYGWYDVAYWFPEKWWELSAELGVNGTEGNSQSNSIRAGAKAKRVTDRDTLSLELIYLHAKNASVLTASNAILDLREDWKFAEDSPWSLFGTGTLQYDEFTAWELRLALNAGLGYLFIENDTTKLKGRFGAGASREFGGLDDRWIPEAVFGADFNHQITAKQKVSLTTDYYPEFGEFDNFRLNTNASWECVLDEEANLSLKVSIIDRYDSTPQGREPNDINYSILLLWSR